MNKGYWKMRKWFILACMCICMAVPSMTANATVSGNDTIEYATEKEIAQGQTELNNYYKQLTYKGLDKEADAKLKEILNNAKAYIGGVDLTASEVAAYVSATKSQMDALVASQPSSTSEFLVVGDLYPTPTVKHGENVLLILPIYNMDETWIDDVTVTAVTSTDVNEWPFEIEKTGYVDRITEIPGSKTKEEAVNNRREVHYNLKAREDVLTGYYKLDFKVLYRRNGAVEEATLSTYVKTIGAPGSGEVGANDNGKTSTPRIIVTGFETSPAEVYAGDTFTLTIHVQNTSKRTSVSNVEFDMQAAKEGDSEKTTYAAFLPTSGSNTVFVDTIAPGGTTDLVIEMTARADLIQKPYVLEVKMNYEDAKYNPFESTASVSIPVKQESKFDLSTPEVMPANINVGDQSNVMFSIYNTGKTTLYNVQVKYEGDSISGGECFVGKVEAGATGNVDSMITGEAPTMDDGTIKALITYEDEAGNPTTREEIITLFVSEAMMEEMPMDPAMMGEEEPKGPGAGVWILIVVLVIAAVVAAVLIIRNKKKKKAAASLLAEDLNMIDLDSEEADTMETEEQTEEVSDEKGE